MTNTLKTIVLTLAFVTTAPVYAETYKFDPGHTEVRFHYSHAGLTQQSGEWGVIDGEINFDSENPNATTASVIIQADSISTGIGHLDEELKKTEFFDVAQFPEITFVTTGIEGTGENTAILNGDITIKGKTAPMSFDITLTHAGEHPVGAFVDY